MRDTEEPKEGQVIVPLPQRLPTIAAARPVNGADLVGLLLAVLEASVGEEETLASMHLLPLVNLRTCNIINPHIGPASDFR